MFRLYHGNQEEGNQYEKIREIFKKITGQGILEKPYLNKTTQNVNVVFFGKDNIDVNIDNSGYGFYQLLSLIYNIVKSNVGIHSIFFTTHSPYLEQTPGDQFKKMSKENLYQMDGFGSIPFNRKFCHDWGIDVRFVVDVDYLLEDKSKFSHVLKSIQNTAPQILQLLKMLEENNEDKNQELSSATINVLSKIYQSFQP